MAGLIGNQDVIEGILGFFKRLLYPGLHIHQEHRLRLDWLLNRNRLLLVVLWALDNHTEARGFAVRLQSGLIGHLTQALDQGQGRDIAIPDFSEIRLRILFKALADILAVSAIQIRRVVTPCFFCGMDDFCKGTHGKPRAVKFR